MNATVRVFYNTTRDAEGIPVGLTDGKWGRDMSGHTFDLVHTYTVPSDLTDADVAEMTFQLMNVVDGSELPVRLGVRSMSTGDAVTITRERDAVTLVCHPVWFEEVTSKLMLIGERVTQTFAMARDENSYVVVEDDPAAQKGLRGG